MRKKHLKMLFSKPKTFAVADKMTFGSVPSTLRDMKNNKEKQPLFFINNFNLNTNISLAFKI